jgi:DNA polymerase-3 subunit gamma/tau
MPAPTPTPTPAPGEPVAQQPAGPQGGLSLVDVRRLWPDILEATKGRRRLAWMVLSQHAHVVAVDARTLTVGFANAGARESFVGGGCDEILRQTAIDVVGMDWRVEAIVDPGGAGADAPVVRQPATPQPATPQPSAPQPPPSPEPGAGSAGPAPAEAPAAPDGPPDWVTGDPAAPDQPSASLPTPAAPQAAGPSDGSGLAAAREALQQARSGESAPQETAPVRSADDDVDPDDPDAESAALDSEALLSQALGAQLIEEITHD